MQVQSLCFILNDPLMLPCVAGHFSHAVSLLEPESAIAVGIGHFELGEPLVAKVRPPTCAKLQGILAQTYANVVLVTAVKPGIPEVHSYDVGPFRYGNWFCTMAGSIDAFRSEEGSKLAIPTYISKNIRGSTVGEVLFHQYLAFLHRQGQLAGERWDMGPLRKALGSALSHDSIWFGEGVSADNSLALSDGRIVLGAALERPVYVRRIEGLDSCLSCGTDVDGKPVEHGHVRGVVVLDTCALPSEEWQTVGPNRVYQIDTNLEFETFSL